MTKKRAEHHCEITRADIDAFVERNRGRTLDVSELADIDRMDIWFHKYRDRPNDDVAIEAFNVGGRPIKPYACQALHELIQYHIN